MRILFLNYEYPPLGGGAGNATFFILQEYAKIPGLAVDLVTSSTDDKYYKEKIGEGITIHKIPIGKNSKNIHFQSQGDLLVYSWKAYFYCKKLCQKNKYDLSHSFFSVPCGFLSLLLKNNFKIPYVVSLRGADVPGYAERFSFVYGLLTPLIKLIWKKSSAVISVSEGLKELANVANPNQKIGVIYNGIDVNHFKPQEFSQQKEKFIITPGASRLASRKGLNYLIEAVHILSQNYPNLYLKIMGDGAERSILEELVDKLNIGDKIEFMGQIPKEKTSPYYQEASVFVLPSLNEGMSNAMLEALASGLPILATDTGGSKELIREGENGFIIKMKDSQDIAEKIEKLIKDLELRRKMGENSRQRALELSWENVAKQYYELYKKISDSK